MLKAADLEAYEKAAQLGDQDGMDRASEVVASFVIQPERRAELDRLMKRRTQVRQEITLSSGDTATDEQDGIVAPAAQDAQPIIDGYPAPQVCNLVGISERQLDYWARTGLVTPSVQPASAAGNPESERLYSSSDVAQLMEVKRLLDAGMPLKEIRRALEGSRPPDPGQFTTPPGEPRR